ncbi:MAG: DNA-directed RNA polymerase subunit beta [Deltaproteobacteria bacterium]|nr:DNA-directed RNA polymerase subunit beta [Deltaproteobacteria bacterium]
MATIVQSRLRHRESFAKLENVIEIPHLIELQKKSYDKFLQAAVPVDEREDIGIHGVFNSVFPIRDFKEISELSYVGYVLEKPKYDVDECRQRGMSYAAPIKVTVQLVIYDTPTEEGEEPVIRDIKEQEVFFGEIPLMTNNGTFIINGTERVVVSQLHRSPGVFFDHDKGKTHSSGKLLYSARLIPYRGSWLDFEFDHKNIIHCRIDRRRKMPATVLLRALGYSTQDLLNYFYNTETVFLDKSGNITKSIEYDLIIGQRSIRDIKIDNKTVVKKNRKFTKSAIRKMQEAELDKLPFDMESLIGKVSAEDIIDEETGEVLIGCNEEITETNLQSLNDAGISSFKILFIDGLNFGSYLRDTLLADKVATQDEAILEIYRRLRPGDPPTPETANNLFNNLFFNQERYDLSQVGRLKLNYKFRTNESLELRTLTKTDIMETVKHLISLKNGKGSVDDIDHLGNRRVRAVGELMESQYRIGLVRMERAIKERMSMSQELETLMPHDLINAKPVSAVVKEYFGSSQLSQFMDQTNPLSEVTHKRRLSALGPGGLTRERAGFEVRDVHSTHYGRICPIETPEGPNIGLIASLSTFAKVNDYGFVESPYREIKDGKITDNVKFFSALEEEEHVIAQAHEELDENGCLVKSLLSCRHNGELETVTSDQVTLMDVSPNQLVSVAASLIPFLEHDDANRALMGSNMQRQAVPLLRSSSPIVGTGFEEKVAKDSGVTVVAKSSGIVESVDASRIVVRSEGVAGDFPDIYNLVKFRRSNQNTCINQKPIVVPGEKVVKGQVLADGPSSHNGELALGQNILVAFMPWGGYNYEDSILMSERLAKNDSFTSIHIEEFECVARDTKLGQEEITRDIPNVGEEALANLDESGIIRIGARVKQGDILVGKITPKGETQLSPEEKLLRAIFGEKAGDVRDSSLRVSPGVSGVVIDARVFSRKGTEKDERAREIEEQEKARLEKNMATEIRIIRESAVGRIAEVLSGQKTTAKLVNKKGDVLIDKDTVLTVEIVKSVPRKYLGQISIKDGQQRVLQILESLENQQAMIEESFYEKIESLSQGDELPPGVIKMVKLFIAIKRRISVGDKMAGRHGNKGVISRILPEEDMPFMQDGVPVDVVLNPLGVPSRMNVGQILETHLGGAGRALGLRLQEMLEERGFTPDAIREKLLKVFPSKSGQNHIKSLNDDEIIQFAKSYKDGILFATPVFDGAAEVEIRTALKEAELPESGQLVLYDGRTGDAFDQNVTVGVMYVLKLHHLVDDKIHARSIGPYSLVTQQPLGGKAQFGGQRLGEMEVWAMEAYGAAYALQEFLTVKSDDVMGRTRMYESIVKGEQVLEAGLPESFNVLLKELQSLCLNVELVEGRSNDDVYVPDDTEIDGIGDVQ